jgi:glycosyltransferase involved in cell wall biosynthesis
VRILQVIPAYFPATLWGGPIHAVYDLNRALVQLAGLQIRVLTTDGAGPGVPDRLEVRDKPFGFDSGHEVFYCRRNAGDSVSLELVRRLPALVRWADVVHLHFVYSFPTIPALLACRAARRPLVWSTHGALQTTYEWAAARRKLLKKVWLAACAGMLQEERMTFHATSDDERTSISRRFPLAKVGVIPFGITVPEALQPRSWKPDGGLRLGFLGRLDPVKGLENLLEALALLSDPSISLAIAGEGEADYMRELERRVRDASPASPIAFVGHVDGDAKSRFFADIDILVLPSFKESFGVVVAEALAHGVPVIASSKTPWQELERRRCGMWVDNTPAALADAIRRMRLVPLADWGARGRSWMQEAFNWTRAAREMLDLYSSVLIRRATEQPA